MLRRLDCDRIVDSGFRIRPKIRCDLRCAAERNQNTVRDVAFGEAEFLRAGTIDLQLQLRRRHRESVSLALRSREPSRSFAARNPRSECRLAPANRNSKSG